MSGDGMSGDGMGRDGVEGDHGAELRTELLNATDFLRRVASDRALLTALTPQEKQDLLNAAGDVFCPDPEERRVRTKALKRQRRSERIRHDDTVLAGTGIRTLRDQAVFTTPNIYPPADFVQRDADAEAASVSGARIGQARETIDEQHCYVCKAKYREVHHFYDQLCADCGDLNYAKRAELADLTGMVALLTGGRVKIGYQAGIKLLRCGAELIVATRFPRDAAARYAAEPDFAQWGDRLEVFGLDLRHTPSVEAFAAHIGATRDRLDLIVNNACQTVRRPPDFYRHMMQGEEEALEALSPEILGLVGSYERLRGRELASGGRESGGGVPGRHRRSGHSARGPHAGSSAVADPAAARGPRWRAGDVSGRAPRPGSPTGGSP
jgi:hypothetical protein